MTAAKHPPHGLSALERAEQGNARAASNEALRNDSVASWTLTIPAVVRFINLNQRIHWAEKARLTKAWRNAAHVFASGAKLPKGLERVHIVAHIIKPTARKYDVHNLMPTLKACIDGLVDYGLIADDTNDHLTGPDLRQGDKGDAAVVLTITATA